MTHPMTAVALIVVFAASTLAAAEAATSPLEIPVPDTGSVALAAPSTWRCRVSGAASILRCDGEKDNSFFNNHLGYANGFRIDLHGVDSTKRFIEQLARRERTRRFSAGEIDCLRAGRCPRNFQLLLL